MALHGPPLLRARTFPAPREHTRFPVPSASTRVPRERVTEGPSKSDFSSVFQSLTTEMDRGEAAMHAITRGGVAGASLSTTDLLTLQAQVYRYSEAIDMAAKLVDRASNGVKTVLTGQ